MTMALRLREPLEITGGIGIRAASRKYGVPAKTVNNWALAGEVEVLSQADDAGEVVLLDERSLRQRIAEYRDKKRRLGKMPIRRRQDTNGHGQGASLPALVRTPVVHRPEGGSSPAARVGGGASPAAAGQNLEQVWISPLTGQQLSSDTADLVGQFL